MAASIGVNIVASLLGLGKAEDFIDRFESTVEPTRKNRGYQVQAVADTDEALGIGDVSTIDLIIIKAVAKDLLVDTSFNAAFSSEITVPEGHIAMFKPSGIVYIKNGTGAEQVTVEYIVIGR